MPNSFLYHAEAVGASGGLTLPVREAIDLQASIALGLNGGHGTARVENFNHRNVLKFALAESTVVGSFSEKDNAHGTLTTTVVEGLNILDVVTCDRIVARLTSKHDVGKGDASFMLFGTRFENLRIGGIPFDPCLCCDLFNECSTWSKLNAAYTNDPVAREKLNAIAMYPQPGDKLPVANGIYGCTLNTALDKLPAGLRRKERTTGIYVPHFGTVFIAPFYVSNGARRFQMLHVDLGCSVEGCYGIGHGGGNGQGYP